MKIAYFTESLPPKKDGVARTLGKLADTLQAENIEFKFFSPFKPNLETNWSDRVVQVSSIPFWLYPEYRVGIPDRSNLFRILNEFKPDIIHSVSPTPLGLYGADYAVRKHIPAVSSYHTHFVSYFKYYRLRALEKAGWNYLKWFYNKFKRIYVPSRSAVTELQQQGFQNLELWQRGIDLQNFSPRFRDEALRRQIREGDEPILLFVGRLVKEKDLDDLVETNRILQAQNYQYKIVIVGDGPMKPRLEQDLPNAHFTGFLQGKELSTWFASSDIFVFPSTTETFGNVILEAYSSGLPVIGVDQGGVTDIIQHQHTGFIARANAPADFARKIKTLLDNVALRRQFSQNALGYAKNFSWSQINLRLIRDYESIITQFNRN
jgi:glycosyltransferase involved in cell wall biosynthesis